jgi:hypothetical protein
MAVGSFTGKLAWPKARGSPTATPVAARSKKAILRDVFMAILQNCET